jgi:uncharacterized protein (TIGR02679 family)
VDLETLWWLGMLTASRWPNSPSAQPGIHTRWIEAARSAPSPCTPSSSSPENHPPHLPASAAAQRSRLETVGVYADSLSTDVLVLGLHAVGDSHVDRLLNEAAAAGEPIRLTLRMLRRAPPALDPDHRLLSVCENPSVVETAAERLGTSCAPLVCTDGMPRTAVLRLLHHASGQ